MNRMIFLGKAEQVQKQKNLWAVFGPRPALRGRLSCEERGQSHASGFFLVS